jgi:heat shock protein HtpX
MSGSARVGVLFIILVAFFAVIGWVLGFYFFGNPIMGLLIFLGIAAVMNLVAYAWSDKIVLRAYGAKIVNEGDAPRLYRSVKKVTQFTDLPMPKVAMISTKNPNAFATGRNPENAVVAVTEGLMDMLNDDELEGVIAHELAHVSNRDILVMSVAATLAGAIAFAARWAFYSAMFGRRDGGGWLLILVAVTAPIAAFMIRAAISRQREFKADATGAGYIGKPWALADALKKLDKGNKRFPFKRGNPASSHLFIVNPFMGGLASLFSTHPPMDERIRRLRAMSASNLQVPWD